jgi:HAD superfamily hydrolase (TIGR01509 family)
VQSIDAVIFDMDGLMLDTEALYKPAWQSAGRSLGFELDDEFYLTLVGLSRAGCEEQLRVRFGHAFPLTEFLEAWVRIWREDVARSGIRAKPGLHELLTLLEDSGIPVGMATSTQQADAELCLTASGLAGRFGSVVTGDQVKQGKPSPDIYLEAARRLGVTPASCLALEDSEAGVLSASRAGMRTILIPDLKPATAEAIGAASWMLPSLADAHALIESLLS